MASGVNATSSALALRGAFWIPICIAIVKLNVATLGPTEFLEALPESSDKSQCLCIFTERDQHADATDPIARLLRTRHPRPSRRSAKK
jgi:hypothetical protein